MFRRFLSIMVFILLLVLLPGMAYADGSKYQELLAKITTSDAGTAIAQATSLANITAANTQLVDSARQLYLKQAVPVLLEDKAVVLAPHITEDMLKSATLLGPIPVFARRGTGLVNDAASLIANVEYTKTWAFIVVSEAQPLSVIHLGYRNSAYFLSEYTGVSIAKLYLDSCQKLGKADLTDVLLLRSHNDELFVSSDDQIVLTASASNPSPKTCTFTELAQAVALQDQYNRERRGGTGGDDLASYLEGKGAISHTGSSASLHNLFLPISIGVMIGILLGVVSTCIVTLHIRRKRTVSAEKK